LSAGSAPPSAPRSTRPWDRGENYKWWAFTAIGISFFTQVASMSMVFVALSSIADEFGITLRAVTWVVVAQALTISALMMPMGRLADMIGRRRVHLTGLLFFGGGSVLVALAPTFGLLIAARVVMAFGNAMGQSVGTAMVISVFPASERGNAIGSQTTAVAVGGASGPIFAGLILQFLPWQALFWMITVPIAIAFVAGYFILDDKRLNQFESAERPPFDWGGAVLSAAAIVLLVITMNNPLSLEWLSPAILGSGAAVVVLFALFARWELRNAAPMLELRLFRSGVLTMAVAARFFGFLGATATRFLAPIFLISLRGLSEAATGGALFLISLGMALAAQGSGRLSDRFGSRPFAVFGFSVLLGTAIAMVFVGATTPMWIVLVILFINGLGMGLWNVPNNAVIMGSVPSSSFGVVGALTNLVRNVGNVTGQALASAVVVAVMVAAGFDIPLSEIEETAGAGAAFIDGRRLAYLLVTAFAAIALVFAFFTKPTFEGHGDVEDTEDEPPLDVTPAVSAPAPVAALAGSSNGASLPAVAATPPPELARARPTQLSSNGRNGAGEGLDLSWRTGVGFAVLAAVYAVTLSRGPDGSNET
jgi:MFS family permease